MAQRTCDVDGCDKAHRARGFCQYHWRVQYGKRKTVEVACPTCGTVTTKRADGTTTRRFCSLECRDEWRRQQPSDPMWRAGICRLPSGHPVRAEMARQRKERKAKEPRVEWRTERECPGCGCVFCPLYTPTMLVCSAKCANRVSRRTRRAREHGASGTWTWSEFMRIAQRFGFRCAYCGEKPSGQLDPDHVVPLSRGGANSIANLLPACRACNCDKRDLLLSEWNSDRERRGLPFRLTTWDAGDARFHHLTHALLVA